MSDPNKQNRVKVLSVDPRILIDLVEWQRNPDGPFHIVMPKGTPIPDDVEVLAVNSDWAKRRIELLLCHPSFDEVPVGCRPPMVIDVDMECRIRTFNPPVKPNG